MHILGISLQTRETRLYLISSKGHRIRIEVTFFDTYQIELKAFLFRAIPEINKVLLWISEILVISARNFECEACGGHILKYLFPIISGIWMESFALNVRATSNNLTSVTREYIHSRTTSVGSSAVNE